MNIIFGLMMLGLVIYAAMAFAQLALLILGGIIMFPIFCVKWIVDKMKKS